MESRTPSAESDDVAQLFESALAARRAGRLADAEAGYCQVLACDPDHVGALLNLGNLLSEKGRAPEAEVLQRRAVSLAPKNAQGHNNLAATLIHLDRPEEARQHLEHAIALDPAFAEPLGNLGLLHVQAGRLAEAERVFAKAHALAPKEARFVFHQAQLALLQGRYEEGWALYEARRADGRYPEPASATCRLWQGEPLDGKQIVLAREQGLGDQLHFLRYASLLAARGAIVDVWVAPPLDAIAATAAGVRRVFTEPPDTRQYDFWAPLPGLPGRCATRAENIPVDVPYLSAEPGKVEAWRTRLAGAGAKAGLVWAGSPTHSENRFRSIALAALKPLADVRGWHFYSLQKGDAAEAQLADWPIAALGPQLQDFSDTAAAISALDLVITVDTSVAHLAGALGKPVWILLDAAPDWRWLLDRADSPWYPSARLFRQRRRGDWNPVVTAVADALRQSSFPLARIAPLTAGLARHDRKR